MKVKSFIVKALALYGLVQIAKELTDISIDEHVRKVEKAFAHRVVEVMFDDGSNLQIIFPTEKKAKEAIDELNDILAARGFVTVEDLKDLADIEPEYHDTYFGWKSLDDVRIIRVKRIILDKFALYMPRAQRLKTFYYEYPREYRPNREV